MMHLRLPAVALLMVLGACAMPAPEEEVIIVEPALEGAPLEDPVSPAPLGKTDIDCAAEAVTGDGIGGTGCPAID